MRETITTYWLSQDRNDQNDNNNQGHIKTLVFLKSWEIGFD